MPDIVITMPPVDPAEALAIYPRLTSKMGALWASGRLRTLLESEEGRTAVNAFETMLTSARNQMASFDGKRGTTMRVRVETPEDSSRAMATFVRRMLDMISDSAVMNAIVQEPLDEADRAFIEPYLVALEAGIAGHEFHQRRGPS
jgi:maltooligosyltrehalose synthase